jgi:hypothetical protein
MKSLLEFLHKLLDARVVGLYQQEGGEAERHAFILYRNLVRGVEDLLG